MKRSILYLLPFLLAIGTGCFNTKTNYVPPPVPSGTFTGQFRVLHKKHINAGYDTLKTNIKLVLQNTNQFKLTGDTAVLHAGSYGTFAVDGFYAAFNDQTYPTTNTKPTKNHLSGIYQYYYDGNIFQLLRGSVNVDTLSFQYDLKRSAN